MLVIHVQRLSDVDTSTVLDTGLLTAEDRDRLQSMHSQLRRKQLIAGRAALYSVLSKFDPIGVDDWQLVISSSGKPALHRRAQAGPVPGLHLSISHSRDWVAVAISDKPIGIDIEAFGRQRDVLRLAEEVCHPDELLQLQALSAEAREILFYQYWTLKEAWFKRLGHGIGFLRLRSLKAIPATGLHANAQCYVGPDFVLSLVATHVSDCLATMPEQLQLQVSAYYIEQSAERIA